MEALAEVIERAVGAAVAKHLGVQNEDTPATPEQAECENCRSSAVRVSQLEESMKELKDAPKAVAEAGARAHAAEDRAAEMCVALAFRPVVEALGKLLDTENFGKTLIDHDKLDEGESVMEQC